MLGLNFSSRKEGNCGDFLLFLRQQTNNRLVIRSIHDFGPEGCGPCEYECIHGSCPKNDGLAGLMACLDKEEESIFAIPLYNGNLPSAFYRLLERMSPGLHEETQEKHFWKKVKIILIGNPEHGLEPALQTLEDMYEKAGVKPAVTAFSSVNYGMKATRDRMIENREVRSRLSELAREWTQKPER